MSEVTIGQQLWFVPDRRPSGSGYDTVAKIGREWVTMSGHNPYRFRKDDPKMRADGKSYSSPGRYYLSKEAYEEESRLNRRFQNLIRRVPQYHRPDHLTDADMDELARMFQLEAQDISA